MRVAIWGSYNHGNYGDDIMAIQFASYLKKINVEPSVYRLDHELAKRYGVHTTNSLDELFDRASFCLIGGGGILIDSVPADFEQDFQELHQISFRKNCPVFPISIGGQGRGINALITGARQDFFQGSICQWSTVRLEEDVELLNHLGKQAFYYPDVLLSVSDYWNIPWSQQNNGQVHVGINLVDSLQSRFLARQLALIAGARKDIVFHFIRTYLSNSNIHWELLPKINSPYIKHHIYTDPLDTLKFISSLDLVISYKLHVGLTALALGVPFYSVGGPGKARRFLQTISADFAILPSNAKLVRLGLLLSRPERVRQLRSKFNFNLIKQLSTQSWEHMHSIKRIIEQFH